MTTYQDAISHRRAPRREVPLGGESRPGQPLGARDQVARPSPAPEITHR